MYIYDEASAYIYSRKNKKKKKISSPKYIVVQIHAKNKSSNASVQAFHNIYLVCINILKL